MSFQKLLAKKAAMKSNRSKRSKSRKSSARRTTTTKTPCSSTSRTSSSTSSRQTAQRKSCSSRRHSLSQPRTPPRSLSVNHLTQPIVIPIVPEYSPSPTPSPDLDHHHQQEYTVSTYSFGRYGRIQKRKTTSSIPSQQIRFVIEFQHAWSEDDEDSQLFCKNVLQSVQILKFLDWHPHPNIARLVPMPTSPCEGKYRDNELETSPTPRRFMKFAFEPMECIFADLLHRGDSKVILTRTLVHSMTHQLLSALAHLHAHDIVHGCLDPFQIFVQFTHDPNPLCCSSTPWSPRPHHHHSPLSATIKICHIPNPFPSVVAPSRSKKGKTSRHRRSPPSRSTWVMSQNVLNNWTEMCCRSACYDAPEMSGCAGSKKATSAADMWSVGCLMIDLLSLVAGNPCDPSEHLHPCAVDGYCLPQLRFDCGLKEMMEGLVHEDPSSRLTCEQALSMIPSKRIRQRTRSNCRSRIRNCISHRFAPVSRRFMDKWKSPCQNDNEGIVSQMELYWQSHYMLEIWIGKLDKDQSAKFSRDLVRLVFNYCLNT